MAEKTFSKLKSELDEYITKLEDESLDLDEAIKLYEKSQKIIVEMNKYLKSREAKIKKLTRD